jgi:hypothetical protein
MKTFCNMCAIMIRFHRSCQILSIDVECIQMSADLFDRREILDHAGAAFQDTAFGAERVAREPIWVSGNVLMTGHGCTIYFQFQLLNCKVRAQGDMIIGMEIVLPI